MNKVLQLNYKKPSGMVPGGAFIRGTTPSAWLQEIDSWGIAADGLVCFPVCLKGMDSLRPAGLFVIFGKEIPDAGKIVYPLRVFSGRLFLPVDAELDPEVTEEEIRSLLIWDWQLYHPSIGFAGFEETDRVALADLLEYTRPAATQWDRAHAGNPPQPRLQQISLQKLSADDVLESLKAGVNSKPLADIPQGDGPGQKDENASGSLLDKLGRNALAGALSAVQKLEELLGRDAGRDTGGNTTPGWFSKMKKWLSEKRDQPEKRTPDDLEQKRDRELNRLLNLFDKNTDEALEYALPLDSPYFSRGLATPSSQLSKRDTSFNLGRLGGGGAVDAWDAGNYYQQLRNRYQQAAVKEIERTNFKKAAYIYAHLLGDFHAAANVLQQGKHYREAAALYKDHLKNTAAAAECLEKGGLLLEAAELWVELDRLEKAGDLYQLLDQPETATRLYGQCREQALKNNNYLDAARILEHKLHLPDEAGQTLLEGWKVSNQAEACLTRYFDLVAAQKKEALTRRVQEVFDHQTPKSKKAAFLNVLHHVNKNFADKELENVVQNLAYDIISEQAASGNLPALNALKNFIPDDRLLQPDCNRFILTQKDKPKLKAATRTYQLDKEIKWRSILHYHNQLLVLGTKDNRLHLARANRDGQVEYHLWSQPIKEEHPIQMIADPYYSIWVLIRTGDDLLHETKTLEANHLFDNEVYLEGSLWFPHQPLALAIDRKGGVTLLRFAINRIIKDHYTMNGSLQKSCLCRYDDARPFTVTPSCSIAREMIFHGYFYIGLDDHLVQISDYDGAGDGTVRSLILPARIRLLAAGTDHFAPLRLAVATDKGCILVREEQGNMVPCTGFFAQDMEVLHLVQIPNNYLVIAEKQRAAAYTIQNDKPELRYVTETDAPITGVVCTNIRNQYAILEETGKISIHDLDQ